MYDFYEESKSKNIFFWGGGGGGGEGGVGGGVWGEGARVSVRVSVFFKQRIQI